MTIMSFSFLNEKFTQSPIALKRTKNHKQTNNKRIVFSYSLHSKQSCKFTMCCTHMCAGFVSLRCVNTAALCFFSDSVSVVCVFFISLFIFIRLTRFRAHMIYNSVYVFIPISAQTEIFNRQKNILLSLRNYLYYRNDREYQGFFRIRMLPHLERLIHFDKFVFAHLHNCCQKRYFSLWTMWMVYFYARAHTSYDAKHARFKQHTRCGWSNGVLCLCECLLPRLLPRCNDILVFAMKFNFYSL